MSVHPSNNTANIRTRNSVELLADLPAIGSGEKPTLLFSRREEKSLWDRFVGWILRPIQRSEAKARITDVLKKINGDTDLANITSVKNLSEEVKKAGLLEGISSKNVKTALVDVMIQGGDPGKEFRPLLTEYFQQVTADFTEQIDHSPFLREHKTNLLEGLAVLREFALDPGSSVSLNENTLALTFFKDCVGISSKHYESLEKIFSNYSAAQRDKTRVVEIQENAAPTPLQRAKEASLRTEAFDQLRRSFTAKARSCIAPFESFILNPASPLSREDRLALDAFLENFSQNFLRLDAKTQVYFLPLVIQAEDALLATPARSIRSSDESPDLPDFENMSDPWGTVASRFKDELTQSDPHIKSKCSPACALAMIEYLTVKSEITKLTEMERAAEKRINENRTKDDSKKLEQQKLRALRKKKKTATEKSKKNLLDRAKKSEESAKNLADIQRDIQSLKRQLLNPSNFVRLTHVDRSAENIKIALFDHEIEESEGNMLSTVLAELRADLRAYLNERAPAKSSTA